MKITNTYVRYRGTTEEVPVWYRNKCVYVCVFFTLIRKKKGCVIPDATIRTRYCWYLSIYVVGTR